MERVYELDVFVPQADPPRRNKLAEDFGQYKSVDFRTFSDRASYRLLQHLKMQPASQ